MASKIIKISDNEYSAIKFLVKNRCIEIPDSNVKVYLSYNKNHICWHCLIENNDSNKELDQKWVDKFKQIIKNNLANEV